MPRVITFSTAFPKYHPRAGEPTDFEEQICDGRKIHTIRKGHLWRSGPSFSPRTWTGKPYRSKQRHIAPELKATYTIPFHIRGAEYCMFGLPIDYDQLREVAKNDGLQVDDFEAWFGKGDFDGQIIGWTPCPYTCPFCNGTRIDASGEGCRGCWKTINYQTELTK